MRVIDRRAFIGGSLALGTFARPRATSGQPEPKVARIGILGFSGTAADMVGPEPTRPSVKAFLLGLRELGYVYGRDFVTEARVGEGRPELWPAMAAEMVRLKVDVILARSPNYGSSASMRIRALGAASGVTVALRRSRRTESYFHPPSFARPATGSR
jgi:hypothetical protein